MLSLKLAPGSNPLPVHAPSYVHLALPACAHVHVCAPVCAHCALRAGVRAVAVVKKKRRHRWWCSVGVGAEGGDGEEKNECRRSVGGGKDGQAAVGGGVGWGGGVNWRTCVCGVSLIARGPLPPPFFKFTQVTRPRGREARWGRGVNTADQTPANQSAHPLADAHAVGGRWGGVGR